MMGTIQGKPGTLVKVFEDPITCQKLEGLAYLVRFEFEDDDDREYWRVRFAGEKQTFGRFINFAHAEIEG